MGAQSPKPRVSTAAADPVIPAIKPMTNTTVKKSFVFIIPPFWVLKVVTVQRFRVHG
jgi:hypothetical protein